MLRLFFMLSLVLCHNLHAQTIAPAKRDSLLRRARETHTDALILVQDGKMIVEEYFDNPVTPVYLASISKALTSIAILKLLSDGKIRSIDQPVMDFYPQWRQGQKQKITLRMLLDHTSGLQNERNASLELEPPGEVEDIIQLALAAELSNVPGTVYNYNNKAIALLAGIIEQAGGERMDRYFEKHFFKPMNITSYEWLRDRAGQPKAFAGFRLQAADLAKFGQLMLNGGTYAGKRFIASRWIDSALVPSSPLHSEIGLTWTLIPKSVKWAIKDTIQSALLQAALPETSKEKARALFGKEMEPFMAYRIIGDLFGISLRTQQQTDSLAKATGIYFDSLFRKIPSRALAGYMHSGTGGQYLLILPEYKIVAVRLVRRDEHYKEDRDLFPDFRRRVTDLVKEK